MLSVSSSWWWIMWFSCQWIAGIRQRAGSPQDTRGHGGPAQDRGAGGAHQPGAWSWRCRAPCLVMRTQKGLSTCWSTRAPAEIRRRPAYRQMLSVSGIGQVLGLTTMPATGPIAHASPRSATTPPITAALAASGCLTASARTAATPKMIALPPLPRASPGGALATPRRWCVARRPAGVLYATDLTSSWRGVG